MAINDVYGPSGGTLSNETFTVDLTPQCDGTTQTFTMPEVDRSGSLRIFWNGLRMRAVSISESTVKTFTLSVTPANNDSLVVDYKRG